MKLCLNADSAASRRFVLLPPPGIHLRGAFRQIEGNSRHRQELLHDMQRLRGRIYLQDGAISQTDLTPDGRHIQAIDDESWHLLIVSASNRVVGCTRYLQHAATTPFDRLRVRSAALARCERWSEPLRRSVERELETARKNGFSYVEVGGWAIDESMRGSADALRSVLFTYAWSNVIGGCLGLSTATHRNGSAAILRRIGGRPLEWRGQELPAYFDAHYGCEMEVLRFDSRLPSAKYAHVIEEMKSQIPLMPVITNERQPSAWQHFVNRIPTAATVLPWSESVAPAA
jgi:hypothetical protein